MPLHMKQTPAEREREEERAWRKAQRAARKSRRLHSDGSERHSKRKRSRSPLSSRKKPDSVPPFSEYGVHDEGWAPPPSSSKVDLDALRAEMEERRFREKLFDAMGDDSGLADTEARFNEYNDYVPPRWRDDNQDDPSQMDDEQYAEWVREGMWRRTHRAEVEAQGQAEEERKQRKEQEKARRAKTKRMEREESERRSKRRQANEQKSIVDAWIAYDARWTQLRSGSLDSKSGGLAFGDLPWPCYPTPTLPLDPNDLSRQAVSSFLLSPLHSVGKPRKQRLREALLLYHPDRFVAKWMAFVQEGDVSDVQEAVGRVARVLTGLVEEGDQGE